MTGQPSPNHAATLPPASTTNYSTQGVGAALAARSRRNAPPVQEGRTEDIARVADLYDAPAVPPAQAVQEAPQARPVEGRPMRLSELAAAVSRAKQGQRRVAEARDPDGADDGGYDPSEIVRSTGSSAGVAASVVASLNRRRGQ